MKTLTERLAGYLTGKGQDFRAVMRTGDKGQCIHLAPKAEGREPSLCGIDRRDNGKGVVTYRRSTFFGKGAWRALSVISYQGQEYLVSGSLLTGWRPDDRHLCQKCLHALPKK